MCLAKSISKAARIVMDLKAKSLETDRTKHFASGAVEGKHATRNESMSDQLVDGESNELFVRDERLIATRAQPESECRRERTCLPAQGIDSMIYDTL